MFVISSLYASIPKKMNNPEGVNKMLYATNSPKEFSPSYKDHDETKKLRASRKYLSPKTITMNLTGDPEDNDKYNTFC